MLQAWLSPEFSRWIIHLHKELLSLCQLTGCLPLPHRLCEFLSCWLHCLQDCKKPAVPMAAPVINTKLSPLADGIVHPGGPPTCSIHSSLVGFLLLQCGSSWPSLSTGIHFLPLPAPPWVVGKVRTPRPCPSLCPFSAQWLRTQCLASHFGWHSALCMLDALACL